MDYLENSRSLAPTALPAIREPGHMAGSTSPRALTRAISIIDAHHVREITQLMAAARTLGATEFQTTPPILRVFDARIPGNGGKVCGFEYVGSSISIKF